MAVLKVLMPLAAVVVLLYAGVANATTCAAGFKDCDKNYNLNGCEVNVHTDVNNCGDCGLSCLACANAVASCKAAKCEYACKAPWMNCDNTWANGCEVDVSKDVNNCGACGKQCTPVPHATVRCNNHQCVYTCDAGWKNCNNKWDDGCETEVTKNVNACGACGAMCMKDLRNAVTKCENHKCVYSCKAGWANCNNKWEDGCECNPGTDVNHCGGCGKKCRQPKYTGGEAKCSYGRCETQSCKRGMRYDGSRKYCVNEGGNNGGNKGGKNGGNNGGNGGRKGGKGGKGGH